MPAQVRFGLTEAYAGSVLCEGKVWLYVCVYVFCEMFAALPSAQHDDDDDVDGGKSKRES